MQLSPATRPLQSCLLNTFAYVRHGVTGRVVGLGKADGNLGYGSPRDKEDAWQMRQIFCEAIGIDPHTLVTVGQVHGDTVRHVSATEAGRGGLPEVEHLGIADALITNEPGVALMTLHADCQMILLVDPATPAVATVHAGWRGTVLDIAGKTVQAMTRHYGTNPADLHAFLGPAICGISNEVGPEVTAAWRDIASTMPMDVIASAITRPGPKEHFNVPRANELLLLRAGLLPEHLDISPVCTRIDGDHWFSHRGQGPLTGRHGSIITLVQP